MDTTPTPTIPQIASMSGQDRIVALDALAEAAFNALPPLTRQSLDEDWDRGFVAGVSAALPHVWDATQMIRRVIPDEDELARAIFAAAPPANPHGPDSDLVFDEPYTHSETERARKIARVLLRFLAAQPTVGQLRHEVAEAILAAAAASPKRDEEEQTAFTMRLMRADYFRQAATIAEGAPRG